MTRKINWDVETDPEAYRAQREGRRECPECRRTWKVTRWNIDSPPPCGCFDEDEEVGEPCE